MDSILQYAYLLCNNNLKLNNFCQFSKNLKNNNLEPTKTSASSVVANLDFKGSIETFPIIEAIKKGASDRDAIRAHLASLNSKKNSFTGLTGTIFFNKNGSCSVDRIDFYRVEERKFKKFK